MRFVRIIAKILNLYDKNSNSKMSFSTLDAKFKLSKTTLPYNRRTF